MVDSQVVACPDLWGGGVSNYGRIMETWLGEPDQAVSGDLRWQSPGSGFISQKNVGSSSSRLLAVTYSGGNGGVGVSVPLRCEDFREKERRRGTL